LHTAALASVGETVVLVTLALGRPLLQLDATCASVAVREHDDVEEEEEEEEEEEGVGVAVAVAVGTEAVGKVATVAGTDGDG
jgi:hypothetical protein